MKVVINVCFGGFGLSQAVYDRYNELTGKNVKYQNDITRDDIVLVQVVEELGQEANGHHSELKIVEIPDGISWFIDDYDGMETIHETHRTWS